MAPFIFLEGIGNKIRNAAGDRSITYLKCLADRRYSSSGGIVCTRRVIIKWPPIRTRARVLPHSLRATSLSPNYLDFRPWTRIPDDRNVKMMPSAFWICPSRP